jgi:hypothetical protein
MAERREEQFRELAVAIIQDCGGDAYNWARLRAANFRKEGDHPRAQKWEYVADIVLKIQGRLENRYYY